MIEDKVLEKKASASNVEDAYPASPVQEGMLFHSLYEQGSGVYVTQIVCALRGLRAELFERAWQHVVARHQILRTAFVWKSVERPLQVVGRQVRVVVKQVDGRDAAPEEREARFKTFLAEDRRRGFDVSKAPLMRLTLWRETEDSYKFVWSHHHLLLDGWAAAVVLKEVFVLYEALSRGAEHALADARPYKDYIAWLQRQDIAAAERFWRETLAGFNEPTPFDVDTARAPGAVRQEGYGTRTLRLSEETTARLQSLARAQQLTLSTLVQGAWALMLSRYSGREDVLFGAVVSGRPAELAGVEEMVGLFINTLPVRVRVEGGRAAADWLRELQARQTRARGYEYSPLSEVQRWSEVGAGQQLFDNYIVFENYPMDEALRGEVRSLEVGEVESTEQSSYPLVLAVIPGARLTLQIHHDRGRFEDETVERMLGHVVTLLDAFAEDPERRLERLPMLTDGERRLLLREFNAGVVVPAPREACVHELFEAQAARTPGAVALVADDGRLTFAELNARANRLARRLRALDVGPEARVALGVRRATGMAVGLLGILKAGGVYVPLDPAYPRERLEFMLADSGASVLVAESATAGLLPAASGARVVLLDGEEVAREGAEDLTATAAPENLAYVIYTSGSTGKPKGVAVTHGAAAAHLRAVGQVFGLTAEDRMLEFASQSFDVSLEQTLAPLLAGARVVLRGDEVWGASDFARSMREERLTVANFPPAFWQQLTQEATGGAEFDGTNDLRLLIIGGDAMPAETARRWRRTPLGGARLVNAYGPTETTITATTFEATERAAEEATGALPIGRAVGARSLYILDRAGSLAPLGAWGELYVGGPLLARGYLNQQALTAERFVPDPFSTEAGARMYRTGDVARWLPDGTVEFRGRADGQVKIRGFRVELGEVEAALGRHPAVREAVALAQEDEAGGKQLVAYVVVRGGPGPTNDKWREFLKGWLPDHMTPSAFVSIEALPLTPNGKVDRGALAALKPERPQASEAGDARPASATEEAVAQVWAEVLEEESVGVEENFFDLGGHSLLATQVVSRLRKKFKVELPFRILFEEPTVRGVARWIDDAKRGGDETDGRKSEKTAEASTASSSTSSSAEAPAAHAVVPSISRAPRDGRAPLSFAQQRLWFLHQLEPASASYNVPASVALSGPLDVTAFTAALNEVARRHEVVRTAFVAEGGEPHQVVAPALELTLPLTDLSHLPADERRARALQFAAEEARRPFDLTRPPLLRARLLRLEEDEHVLLLTMHHIISDGWSLGLLVKEMAALYGAYRGGKESPLAELPVQYGDYAAWQRGRLQGAALEEQLSYWREQLRGAPVLDLPTDRPRPRVRASAGRRLSFRVGRGVASALDRLGRAEGATPFMTLLAAFHVLLSRYSGRWDVTVGTPVAGRTVTEAEGLIGLFVNTLAVRAGLDGRGSFREAVRRVREAALGAQQHQEAPFELIVDALQPERVLNRHPLFDVMFVMQNPLLPVLQLPGLRLSPLPVETGAAKFDLTLDVEPTADGLECSLEYDTDLFEEETAARLASAYVRLLEAAVAEPDRAVGELPLLSEEERRRLLRDYNDTARAYEPASLPEMFRRQASRTPDAVAVEGAGGARLNYAELDERSERLARRLRRAGVGPESLVAVHTGRSTEMVVALLGVLKAGAAYLPLDSSNPAERLRFMLADSGARVLLTERRLADSLPEHSARVVILDASDEEESEPESENYLGVEVAADDLAYVIYTSGSTGKPKGVMVTHGGLSNYLRWAYVAYETGRGAGAPVHSPLGFDLTVTGLWTPLVSGTRALLVEEGAGVEPLAAALREGEEFTLLKLTPAHLEALGAELGGAGGGDVRVRRLVVGGEALRGEALRWWREHSPQTRVVNEYGPTEAVVGCCVYDRAAGELEDGAVPVGRPIANTRLYVLDSRAGLAPEGAWGELYIGGAGVARGYLNRPALTAERFVPDPFSGEAGARLYHTGDVVRWGRGGELEYAGRADGQLKLRGYRVEVGEVEAAARSYPLVRDAAVVARGGEGAKRLAAFLVAEDGDELNVGGVREHMKRLLPDYMIPQSFAVLGELPLTANGKVDREALVNLDAAAAGEGATSAAPRTVLEEVVAGIWRDVLGTDGVGVHDNFFERGGHSLLATRFVSRVREAFGVEFDLRGFFESPTVAEVAARIEEARSASASARPPRVRRYERDGEAPLSFAQERLWFFEQLQPGSAIYHIGVAASLKGRLDAGALAKALKEIVRRHEVLRTGFVAEGGEPRQVVGPATELPLPLTDLSRLPADSRAEAAQTLAREESRRPFDLTRPPLLRARLLRLSEEEHVLLLTMHHIVSDGWSMGVFIGEAAELYTAYSEGRESPLAELPVQYADYAMWERERLSGASLDGLLDYWRGQLRGARPLALPTDRPRPSAPSHKGADEPMALTEELSRQLKALADREGVTLFMLMLAAFDVLLSERAGHDDVSVGTDIANRNLIETENLIGFFINQLVLRTDLSGDPTFRELLARVREVTLGAYAHQDMPFDRLVDALKVERSLLVTPLFQVKLIFQNAPMPPIRLPGLALDVLEDKWDAARFDLTLALYEEGHAVKGWFEYNTDLFDAETVAALGDDFETLLRQFVARPELSIGEAQAALAESRQRRRIAREEGARDALSQKLKTARRKAVAFTPRES